MFTARHGDVITHRGTPGYNEVAVGRESHTSFIVSYVSIALFYGQGPWLAGTTIQKRLALLNMDKSTGL